MKKLLLTVMLISITTLTMAKEIDLSESKGTDQEVIASITPTPESLTVDENITLKVTFDVELDEKHVKKNDIKLKNILDTHKNIEGTVAYVASENAVTFKANEPLEVGYYEIEFKSLKATKANKDKQIKEIKYRFYVAEVINGHMLPPVPDSKINDATLEGVDINNNDVRDDVERKIYKDYSKNIDATLLIDAAKFYQKALTEPTDNAKETQKIFSKVLDCEMYYELQGKVLVSNDFLSTKYLKNITLTTPQRVRKFLDYNLALSGGNYSSQLDDWNREACSPEVVSALEEVGL